MRARKQPFLPGFGKMGETEFGGTRLRGNARESRPLALKRPVHLVMKSSLAHGDKSFLNTARKSAIEQLLYRLGKQKGVKVYRYANSGNHLHLLILPSSERAYRAYIRAVAGVIARITMGAERGRALGKKFWDAKPFTRIVEWGRDFSGVCDYILQNTLEALGFIPYQPRKYKKVRNLGPKAAPS